jgi:uncharacterized membrane protein YiaA
MNTELPTLTVRRAARALFFGSLVGAVLVHLTGVFPALVFEREELLSQWRPSDAQVLAFLFAVSWLVFAAGLAVIGIPLWWICHRLGWRGARTALALGFLATFCVLLILNTAPRPHPGGMTYSYGDSSGEIVTDGHLTSYGWYRKLYDATEMALIGAVVGAVIWRLAYTGPMVRWNIIPGREWKAVRTGRRG